MGGMGMPGLLAREPWRLCLPPPTLAPSSMLRRPPKIQGFRTGVQT